MLTYSNARAVAEFADWPHGRNERTRCTFRVERVKGRGERVSRVTVDPRTGREAKPKVTTAGLRAAIVDGSDGKTYVVTLTIYGGLSVMRGTLDVSQESVFPGDDRYPALRAMVEGVQS